MKEKNVINYYVLCKKLKNVIRTGWKDWSVNRDRLESVAVHIWGTQMLAIAMKSEFEYDIDIIKVIYMLAIHELGETVIGDINGDDSVTSADLITLIKMILGTEKQNASSDLNGDGKTDSADLLELKKILAK